MVEGHGEQVRDGVGRAARPCPGVLPDTGDERRIAASGHEGGHLSALRLGPLGGIGLVDHYQKCGRKTQYRLAARHQLAHTRAMASRVADLLHQSRAAHADYRRASGRTDKDGLVVSAPDYAAAEAHVARALTLRQQAHDADPLHTDPAWDSEKHLRFHHDDLVAFYRAYPQIP